MNYIPRTPYVPGGTPNIVPERVKKKRIVHVFSIFGWVVFSLAVVAFVGAYVYKEEFATQKLIKAKKELNEVSSKARGDDKQALEMVQTNSYKMQLAETLLKNHLAPSRILTHIEILTKKTVQYASFEYKYDPGFSASVQLDGITDTLKSAFAQKQGYGAAQLFSDYKVSGIALKGGEVGEDGTVISEDSIVFNFEGILKNDMVQYMSTLTDTSITSEDTDINSDTASSSEVVPDTQPIEANTATTS